MGRLEVVTREDDKGLCEKGDCFFVDDGAYHSDGPEVFMVCSVGPKSYRLVALSTGNRFDDKEIFGASVKDVLKDFHTPYYFNAKYYRADDVSFAVSLPE